MPAPCRLRGIKSNRVLIDIPILDSLARASDRQMCHFGSPPGYAVLRDPKFTRPQSTRPLLQNFQPWIHLTPSDFESLTRYGDLCNKEGALEFAGFEAVMREQVTA